MNYSRTFLIFAFKVFKLCKNKITFEGLAAQCGFLYVFSSKIIFCEKHRLIQLISQIEAATFADCL